MHVACHRRTMAAMRTAYHGIESSGREAWAADITGALSEMAVSVGLKLPWNDPIRAPRQRNADGDRDVGDFEVRSTTRERGSLILYPKDADDAPFILVTGQLPTFELRGWVYGHEGKQERFWRTDVRSPAFFVPQSALKPLGDLQEAA